MAFVRTGLRLVTPDGSAGSALAGNTSQIS